MKYGSMAKKGKAFQKLMNWITELNSNLRDEYSWASDVDPEDFVSMIQQIQLAKANPQAQDAETCPDAYSFTALSIVLMNKTFQLQDGMTKSDRFFEVAVIPGGSREFRNPYDSFVMYYKSLIDQIEGIMQSLGETKEPNTLKFAKKIWGFLDNAIGLKADDSMIGAGIFGFLYVHTFALQFLIAEDKELFKLAKKFIIQSAKNGAIYGKNQSLPYVKIGGFVSINSIFGSNSSHQKGMRLLLFPYDELIKNKMRTELQSIASTYNLGRGISSQDAIRWKGVVLSRIQDKEQIKEQSEQIMFELIQITRDGEVDMDEACSSWEEMMNMAGAYDEDISQNPEMENQNFQDGLNSLSDAFDFGLWGQLGQIWEGKLGITSPNQYMQWVFEVFYSMKESGGSLNGTLEFKANEELERMHRKMTQLESVQSIGVNPLKMSPDPIMLTGTEINLGEFDIPEWIKSEYTEDFAPDKIVVVEYKQTESLDAVRQSTPGYLCVGDDRQGYKQALREGSQRHFGVLAKVGDGYHVVMHTHTENDVLQPMTDANNHFIEITPTLDQDLKDLIDATQDLLSEEHGVSIKKRLED